jgi:hypothetical protein
LRGFKKFYSKGEFNAVEFQPNVNFIADIFKDVNQEDRDKL